MSEEGEFSDVSKPVNASKEGENDSSSSSSSEHCIARRKSKSKKRDKYSSLKSRFKRLESLVTKALCPETNSAKPSCVETNSKDVTRGVTHTTIYETNSCDKLDTDKTDAVSISAGNDFDSYSSDEDLDENLGEGTKKCLFDMFGDDARVQKKTQKDGIILDKSQIEVLGNSFRCSEPNFLTAFSEENVDLFPLDSECDNFLKVPSLDSLVDCCLTKRYGSKASFAKNKGKVLYSQPCKMVDKIGFKGQHAARMGSIMQCYAQQSLGNLLQFIQSEDFDKDRAVQQVKDIFSISTRVLDQLGRAGALHHIIRRTVAMSDTGLYEQHDHLEFANLPLCGEGVFGPQLESLLKSRKEKKKQVDDLIPDVQRSKRKYGAHQNDNSANKRPTFDKKEKTPPGSGNWNNFRIPKYSSRGNNRGSGRSRGAYGSNYRGNTASGKGQLDKPADK